MSEKENNKNKNELQELFELNEREKEGGIYIGGVVVLIALIVILASLTHVVLSPH